MAQALQRHCGDLVPLGPLRPKTLLLKKALRRGLKALTGRMYLFTHTVSLSKQMAGIVTKAMANQKFDLIFAPSGSGQIAHLNTDLPIVYSSDATFGLVLDYYPEFSNVVASCIPEAHAVEQLAIDRAKLILYSSTWAAGSAKKDYHADSAKVHVVPFGANLDEAPAAASVLKKKTSSICKLLFVGADWEKKGGELALETVVELGRLSVAAELTIVGCCPPKTVRVPPNVQVIRFLNKNDVAQRQQLQQLYLDADFFLLPTRSECYGIVFCEAGAFGLPVIGTDTGGVSEIIHHGENGFLLPEGSRGSEYAKIIADTFRDRTKYEELQHNSRADFEKRLNWDAWGRAVAGLIDKMA
jgi:glycosyltransferase involved in cell wall biosynthesis